MERKKFQGEYEGIIIRCRLEDIPTAQADDRRVDLIRQHGKWVEPPGSDTQRFIKFAPGWDAAIKKIHKLGGAVVLFSANLDERTWENVQQWMLDGAPIARSNMVSRLESSMRPWIDVAWKFSEPMMPV